MNDVLMMLRVNILILSKALAYVDLSFLLLRYCGGNQADSSPGVSDYHQP